MVTQKSTPIHTGKKDFTLIYSLVHSNGRIGVKTHINSLGYRIFEGKQYPTMNWGTYRIEMLL